MGYHVIINEIVELEREIGRKMRDWMGQLNAVLGQLQAFNSYLRENDSGKTVESICDYMEEVHTYLLHELYVLSEEMLERVVMYAEGYYEIEPDTTAGEIAQTSLEGQEEILQKGKTDLLDVAGLLETELAKISDLLPLKAPPTEGVEDSLTLLLQTAEDLRVRIGEYEEAHLSQDFAVMEGMTEALQAFIERYSGKQAVVMDSYERQSFESHPEVMVLVSLEAARDYLREGNPQIQKQKEAFLNRMAAEDRMAEGKSKIVGGLLITVSAVVTVVIVAASWGTATPVAASVWGNGIILASSGMSAAYGMSETIEGIDLYRLGAEGDTLTIAKNPVRDVVFGGNEELYRLWGEACVCVMNLSMLGSGLSGAYRAGGLKAVGLELGKIGLSEGAGTGTQWFLEEKLGMDQTDALLAGIAVSTVTYAGLNRLHGNVIQRYRVKDADGIATSYADLMSPEDVTRYLKFLETGSTEGLTPEELLGIRKVEEYLALSRVDYDEVLALRRAGYEGGRETVIYGTDDIAKYQYNMIENPGPLAEMPNQPAKNFYGGRYNVEVLQEDKIMYRAGNANNPYGRWFTSEPPASVASVRIDTAVKLHWIDPKTGAWEASSYIDNVYAIKIPKGTTVYTGPVGPQGSAYMGGYNVMQTYIDAPWNFEVIGKTPLQ